MEADIGTPGPSATPTSLGTPLSASILCGSVKEELLPILSTDVCSGVVDNDDHIDLILMALQTEQTKYQEKIAELQRHTQEIFALRYVQFLGDIVLLFYYFLIFCMTKSIIEIFSFQIEEKRSKSK